MAPESPSFVIALDLEWNGSSLECQVDRYSMAAQSDFMYVSWDAIECPQNYKPIGESGAYLYIPEGTFLASYRAEVRGNEKDGYRWRDDSFNNGVMFILTLPHDYVFTYPYGDLRFPIDSKYSNDCRMSLYWWITAGRFTLKWHMKPASNLNIKEQCELLSEEAFNRAPDIERPPHFDGLDTTVPSNEPKIDPGTPDLHRDIELSDWDWQNLGGPQLKELNDALIEAFPNERELAKMVQFGMNCSLEDIVSTDSLSNMVFGLTIWCKAHGKQKELFDAALEINPQNPALQRIQRKQIDVNHPASL